MRPLAIAASAAMLGMTVAVLHQNGKLLPVSSASARTIAPTVEPVAPWARLAPATPMTDPDDVSERIRSIVPSELFDYFDLYLYVSKAARGPWAQQMFVFHQTSDGDLAFEEDFPVSTGRERMEKYFTSTPEGLFELDPDRFDRAHVSHRWHNAPMPWAMFLNYTIRGSPTGIALHSAIGHEAKLGRRASGGCIRLPPGKAEEFFRRIQTTEAGRVPVFAMDATGITTDKTGRILRDADGTPLMTDGYRVLLIIEDYPGEPLTVASVALS